MHIIQEQNSITLTRLIETVIDADDHVYTVWVSDELVLITNNELSAQTLFHEITEALINEFPEYFLDPDFCH